MGTFLPEPVVVLHLPAGSLFLQSGRGRHTPVVLIYLVQMHLTKKRVDFRGWAYKCGEKGIYIRVCRTRGIPVTLLTCHMHPRASSLSILRSQHLMRKFPTNQYTTSTKLVTNISSMICPSTPNEFVRRHPFFGFNCSFQSVSTFKKTPRYTEIILLVCNEQGVKDNMDLFLHRRASEARRNFVCANWIVFGIVTGP